MSTELPATADGSLRVLLTQAASRTRVSLVGELDLATAGQLRPLVDALLDTRARRVQVDLSLLSFCDASGLTGLLDLHHRLGAAGVRLTLTGLSPMMGRLLSLTRLDHVLVVS